MLFGGETPTGLTNQTLLYNETANRWTSVSPTRAPNPLRDFGFAVDPPGRFAVLFGGLRNLSTGRVSNATWTFSFVTENWTNVTRGSAPAARAEPAFSVGNGTALLFGGRDPNASGSGQLTFGDTWLLNLTTDTWRRVTPVGSGPGPLFGASLTWDPQRGVFLLFGGCYPCSSTVWTFSPTSLAWSALPSSGAPPPGRADATWSYDPLEGVDLLFGGTNGTTEFNDTYLYNPVSLVWMRITSASAPSPRVASAADFLAVPGNETLLLTGGGGNPVNGSNGSWRLAPVTSLLVQVANASSGSGVANALVGVNAGLSRLTNATGALRFPYVAAGPVTINVSAPGFAPANRSLWLPTGPGTTVTFNLTPLPPATVIVQVESAVGPPVPNARVNVSVDGQLLAGSPRYTNGYGLAVFWGVPAAMGGVSVSAGGYHTNSTAVDFAPGGTTSVNLTLFPMLELAVRAFGSMPNGSLPTLTGVAISLEGFAVGSTGPGGYLNLSTSLVGPITLTAAAYGFRPRTVNVTAEFSGVEPVNLTLVSLPFPTLVVSVLGLTSPYTRVLVANASIVLRAVGLPSGNVTERVLTGPNGTGSFSVPTGNYTVTASARGFLVSTPTVLALSPSASVTHSLLLQPEPLSTLGVEVVSSAGGHAAIPGAMVVLNSTAINLTDGSAFPVSAVRFATVGGWANFSGLAASLLNVTGSAPGYLTNSSQLTIDYGQTVSPFVLELAPLPAGSAPPLALGSGGLSELAPLALVPTVGLVGGLVYLTMLRSPRAEEGASEDAGPPSSRTVRARDKS